MPFTQFATVLFRATGPVYTSVWAIFGGMSDQLAAAADGDAAPASPRRSNVRPLAEQVADVLLARIGRGDYKPGDKLPAGDKLGAELEVSDATIERARALLRELGVLRMTPLEGSFVCDPLPDGLAYPLQVPQLDRRGLRSSAARVINRDAKPMAAWVTAALKARIAAGEFPPGSQLPVRQMLMEDLDIGRHTLDEAMRRLSKAGIIWSKATEGTFVCDPLPPLSYTTVPARPAQSFPTARRQPGRSRAGKPWPPVADENLLGFGTATPQEFGQALRAARRAAGLVQNRLADALGVPHTTLAELERGYLRYPDPHTLHRVASFVADPTVLDDLQARELEQDPEQDAEQDAAGQDAADGEPGERQYFLAWRYWDVAVGGERTSNHVVAMPAAGPRTLEEIRDLEGQIAEYFGHTDVKLNSWQPMGRGHGSEQ